VSIRYFLYKTFDPNEGYFHKGNAMCYRHVFCFVIFVKIRLQDNRGKFSGWPSTNQSDLVPIQSYSVVNKWHDFIRLQ